MSVDSDPQVASPPEFWKRLNAHRNARRVADQARSDWDLFLATRTWSGSGPPMLLGAAAVLDRLKSAEEAESESRDALIAWIMAFGP